MKKKIKISEIYAYEAGYESACIDVRKKLVGIMNRCKTERGLGVSLAKFIKKL